MAYAGDCLIISTNEVYKKDTDDLITWTNLYSLGYITENDRELFEYNYLIIGGWVVSNES